MSTPDQPPQAVPPRQRIERVAGGRRVRLTPAPGAGAEPVPADTDRAADAAAPSSAAEKGPNDDRLRADVPPHY